MRQTLLVSPDWVSAQNHSEWLTPSEQSACVAPVSIRRRRDKVAGRIALKRLLWETFGIDSLAYEIGSDGPAPMLFRWPGPEGLVVSLSHSGGWGAASWAWVQDEGTVGVDVQEIRSVHPRLAERALTSAEQALDCDALLLWALKEAGIKALRQPWGRPLRDIVVSLANADAEEGDATLTVANQHRLTARYARHGHLWLARAAHRDVPPRRTVMCRQGAP